MTNLLKETEAAIASSGHTTEDISFIGSLSSGHSCTWNEFKTLADMEYDSGFGGQEVASDLMIYFSDGASMWRGEYDGSEWWEHGVPFTQPVETKPITKLKVDSSWTTLEEMHKPGGKYGFEDV